MSFERETVAGVPIGLSRDYDHLPCTGPLRAVRCDGCWQLYEDVEREWSDGCQILAVMCRGCRERSRAQWIAEQRAELPRAIVVENIDEM